MNKTVVHKPFTMMLTLAAVLLISACSNVPVRLAKDTDNDGVADAIDACLQTAQGSPVNEQGCSLFRGAIKAVEFAPNDHQLDAQSRESLAELVELLKAHPEVVLQLEGHTDNRGPARENLALSKRRVMSVVKFMVAHGVDGDRLKPVGYGENRPVKSNATEAGRRENRRIEMSVFTQ